MIPTNTCPACFEAWATQVQQQADAQINARAGIDIRPKAESSELVKTAPGMFRQGLARMGVTNPPIGLDDLRALMERLQVCTHATNTPRGT